MKKAGTRTTRFSCWTRSTRVERRLPRRSVIGALLEVLDPEQNSCFPGQLPGRSLTTCQRGDVHHDRQRDRRTIPQALLRDRCRGAYELAGYTDEEKLEIARRFLVDKQRDANGLKRKNVTLEDAAIIEIIRRYTREAGVRSLEREIASVFRKVARQIVTRAKDAAPDAISVDAELGSHPRPSVDICHQIRDRAERPLCGYARRVDQAANPLSRRSN